MNKRGQSSFEILLIATVILILSLMVVGRFFSMTDSTTAMAILKTYSLEKIGSPNTPEFHAIREITYVEPGFNQIDLTVSFEPAWPDAFDGVEQEIKDKISERTKYSTVNISITS